MVLPRQGFIGGKGQTKQGHIQPWCKPCGISWPSQTFLPKQTPKSMQVGVEGRKRGHFLRCQQISPAETAGLASRATQKLHQHEKLVDSPRIKTIRMLLCYLSLCLFLKEDRQWVYLSMQLFMSLHIYSL